MTAEPKPTRLEEVRKFLVEEVQQASDLPQIFDDALWLLTEVDRLKEELQLADEALQRANLDLKLAEAIPQFEDDYPPELTHVINGKATLYRRVK